MANNSENSLVDDDDDEQYVVDFGSENQGPETKEHFVITCSIVGTVSHKSHVAYTIQVQVGYDKFPDSKMEWKVNKRYKQFVALHEELAALFPKKNLPELPKKHLLRNLDPGHIENKRKDLHRYLHDLLQDRDISNTNILSSFLAINFRHMFFKPSFYEGYHEHKAGLDTHKSEIGSLKAKITTQETKIDHLETERARLSRELEDLKVQFEAANLEKNKLTQTLVDKEVEIKKEKEHSLKIQQERDAIASASEAQKTSTTHLGVEFEHLKEAVASLGRANTDLAVQNEDLDQRLKKVKQEKKILIDAYKQLQQQVGANAAASAPIAAQPEAENQNK